MACENYCKCLAEGKGADVYRTDIHILFVYSIILRCESSYHCSSICTRDSQTLYLSISTSRLFDSKLKAPQPRKPIPIPILPSNLPPRDAKTLPSTVTIYLSIYLSHQPIGPFSQHHHPSPSAPNPSPLKKLTGTGSKSQIPPRATSSVSSVAV